LPTGTGVYYVIRNAKPNGQVVNDGDSVRVHYKLYLLTNATTPVDTTSELRNLPDEYLINTDGIVPGLEDALRKMREGEEATILVPSYKALRENSTHKIPPYSVLRYELKLIDVESEYEQTKEYLTKNNITVTEQKDSVRRILNTAGSPNSKPIAGRLYTWLYEGRLLNGTLFDRNNDSTFTASITQSGLIGGFTTAMTLMNQGETATFTFPSANGYSRQGSSGVIPPYAPLSFKLTLVKTDSLQLREYINANNITSPEYNTTSGIFHKTTQVGTGTQANGNSKVRIVYTGYLLNGTRIALPTNLTTPTNPNEREDTFTLSDVTFASLPWIERVRGLRENIATMKVGEKRLIFLPSTQAFGVDGYLNVRRRTPIFFEVELKEIL
jgi:FKBP-type peptidyl-prolyl cis-trans isomerase